MDLSRVRYYSFQFHIGTIKSITSRNECVCCRHFNSTLVRLKVSEVSCDYIRGANFNSTLVRLKARLTPQSLIGVPSFQFHIGTIKSMAELKPDMDKHNANFNSTLVRLKAPYRVIRLKKNYISIPHWYD